LEFTTANLISYIASRNQIAPFLKTKINWIPNSFFRNEIRFITFILYFIFIKFKYLNVSARSAVNSLLPVGSKRDK